MLKKVLIAAVTLVAAAGTANAQYASQGQYAQQTAPQAQMVAGRYFQFAVLPSFQVTEDTTNGVTLVSQQMNAMYGLIGLTGDVNAVNPQAMAAFFARVSGLANVRVISVKPTQPIAGYTQALIYEVVYTGGRGNDCRMTAVVNTASNGVKGNGLVHYVASGAQNFDQFRGAMLQAVATIFGTSADSMGARAYAAASVPHYSNGGQVGTGGMGNWHPTSQAPSDRQSRDRSDAMLGTARAHDDQGNEYNPYQSQYNPTLQGYENPNRPGEVLQDGVAGE